MTMPRRLLDSSPDHPASVLLASWTDEHPPASGLERVASALGISAAILAQAAVAAAAPAAGAALGGGSVLASGAGALGAGGGAAAAAQGLVVTTGVAKWLGIGFVGGMLAVGGAAELTGSGDHSDISSPSGYQPQPRSSVDRPTSKGSSSLGRAVAADASLTAGEAAPVASADGGVPRRDLGKTSPNGGEPGTVKSDHHVPPVGLFDAPPLGESVAAEIAMVDRARTEIAQGRPAMALKLLDRYDRSAHSALLEPEATVLRVEALYGLGRLDPARSLAKRYLGSHQTGTHAAWLRRFLETTVDGK